MWLYRLSGNIELSLHGEQRPARQSSLLLHWPWNMSTLNNIYPSLPLSTYQPIFAGVCCGTSLLTTLVLTVPQGSSRTNIGRTNKTWNNDWKRNEESSDFSSPFSHSSSAVQSPSMWLHCLKLQHLEPWNNGYRLNIIIAPSYLLPLHFISTAAMVFRSTCSSTVGVPSVSSRYSIWLWVIKFRQEKNTSWIQKFPDVS